MKRFFWSLMSAGVVAVVAGCPIYPDDGNYRVCNGGACYDCPNQYYDGTCTSWQCGSSSDCPAGYECTTDSSGNQSCLASNGDAGSSGCSQPSDCPSGEECGSNGQCQAGDCSTTGCSSGYVCKLAGGVASCVPLAGGDDGGSSVDSSPGDASSSDSATSGCQSNADCTSTGAGSQCLDGVCTAPSGQCFDQTQCPANFQCVQGACTPSCSGTASTCPTGYSCDANGECTGNPTPCGTDQTCAGGTVCVEQHCVAPCGGGGSCSTAGEVCVDGGCIPNQLPQFVCGADGSIGDGQAGDCAIGSICLHHSCFIACNPDAGATACAEAEMFNVCKSVTTSSGTYPVCGSNSNLGNQCDPTQNQPCPGAGVCIDGYCH